MTRHPIDPFSLVFGALFLIMGVAFLVSRVDVWSAHLAWVWPIPLIAIGGLIVFLAVRPRRGEPDELEG